MYRAGRREFTSHGELVLRARDKMDTCRCCLLGAIKLVVPDNKTKILQVSKLITDVLPYGHDGKPTIVQFNDAPKRTSRQVLAVLDRAIVHQTERVKQLRLQERRDYARARAAQRQQAGFGVVVH